MTPYFGIEGNPRTIWQMVKESPEWAANRIQEGEKAIEEVERLKADRDELVKMLDWYSKTLKDTQLLCSRNQATVSAFLTEALSKVQK